MTTPGSQMKEYSVCGEVKPGPLTVTRPGQPQPPFVCSDCLKKQKQSQ